VDGIKDEDMAERVALFLANTLPEKCSVVYAEEYVFSNPLIMSHFEGIMEKRHSRLWNAKLM
jgi:hypothetical protein